MNDTRKTQMELGKELTAYNNIMKHNICEGRGYKDMF
jgi:hypothetical protein